MTDATTATIRPYEGGDSEGLWELKRGFELGIGAETGPEGKAAAYEGKLTDGYRERWLDWVDRCVDEDGNCVNVAVAADATESGTGGDELVGYSFLLPESLSFVWDAAVLNEIFVAPEHRGTGVADGLMDAAVDCARGQDLPLDRMVLDVDRENDRAKAFYERYGFSHWGEMVAREL
ncbi:GNAT family N-acetyltransferase [Halogeometricum luteum]|uniref:GNAT family N-acetyltransferase n=1 Tax=Halogeometricum luteum TaxID=2950537 RepID=A0ABU2G163_9EURY|nr:N-acetyltransferase [Halogeometricum sp. S3BR5-2]MDS0294526.1 GNAT family N-acetyltransferase [Halogeometricum sp. S3BR5-2]